jgi:hypothetical protein
MTHLAAHELADALDHALDPSRQAHLDACEVCRQQLAELDAVLNSASRVEVPEPSPLYWQQLSAQVRAAIAAEQIAAGGWRDWLRWPVLAPVAALALIVMALAVALPRETIVVREVAVVEPVEASLDDRFAIVADLVGDLDWETAMSAGLTVAPGAADQAVLELSAMEQEELTRLLHAELTRAKS